MTAEKDFECEDLSLAIGRDGEILLTGTNADQLGQKTRLLLCPGTRDDGYRLVRLLHLAAGRILQYSETIPWATEEEQ